jgi:hypothetical protein
MKRHLIFLVSILIITAGWSQRSSVQLLQTGELKATIEVT